MSERIKRTLVPALRFPEFRDVGEWEEKLLSEVANVIAGQSPDGSNYNDKGEGVPFYQGKTDFGEIYLKKPTKWTTQVTKLANRGDILMSVRAPVGALNISNDQVCIGRGLAAIQSNQNKWFLYYFLNSAQKSIVGNGGAIFDSINKDQLENLCVKIPFIKGEQQKIADCLSSFDDLITAQAPKLAALKAHKKGLMQQLFPAEGETIPKLRFPEFRDAGDWKEIKLIETVDKEIKWSFIGGPFGSNLKSSDYTPNGVRIIQLQNIGDAEFNEDYKIFTSDEKADELLSCNIYPGDIILSKMGDPVGRACLIPNNHNRYVMCSDGIRLVVNEKSHSKYFIYSLINSIQFRALVEKTATGSTRKRIGLDDLKNLPMVVPEVREQQKIADCLSSIDDLITAQTQKLAALKAHKKGLMQQLFPAVDEVAG